MKKNNTVITFWLKAMRITGVQIAMTIFLAGAVMAHGTAQEMLQKRISISFEKTALPEAVLQLSDRANVDITFNSAVLPKRSRVSASYKDRTLEAILTELLTPYEVSFLVVEGQVVLRKQKKESRIQTTLPGLPQETDFLDRRISGRVTDEKSESLPGVNILLKGTQRGTVTDAEGRFTIDVPDNQAVLVFSFVGYVNEELVVGNRNVIDISMQVDEKSLEELVVVGYGTQSKANLTGAVSQVGAKEIENRPVADLGSALQGTMAGMVVTRTNGQPGAENLQIQVRGATSANGNVNPLLMVDGVPAPINTLQTLNPADVENVTVLKDAAAAAIFGAQAAGGVIMVTTKKGSSGKAVFEYSNLFGVDWMQNVPGRISLMDEALYTNLSNKNAGLAPAFSDNELDLIRRKVEYYIHPVDTNYYVYYNQQDFTKQMIRDYTSMQTHNLSARGGTDQFNYLASFGVYTKQGAFRDGPDRFDRYNARLNMGAKLNRYLSLESRVTFTKRKQEAPSIDVGSLLDHSFRRRMQNPIFTPEGRLSSAAGEFQSVYAILVEGGYNNRDDSDLNGVFTLKAADFIKGLQLRAIYGTQMNRRDQDLFSRTVELWQRTFPNLYINLPNSYTVTRGAYNANNLQFLADYHLNIGAKNNLDFLAGYQFEDVRSTSLVTAARNLVSNDLPALGLGDNTTKTNSEAIATYANQSFFGRVNYSYDNRYLLEATVRSDESSRLAPGLRTKVFPSASAGWNIHQESWFMKRSPISQLKLRASWGQLGSALANIIGNYDYLSMLLRNDNMLMGAPSTRSAYFYQNVVPSSRLTWETVETTNGGIDLGLFNHKLSLSADYYVKYNRNMLTPLQLPATFGVGTPRVNNGVLKSWGWELEGNYRDKAGELSYSLGFNLSDNKNKLIKYAGRTTVSTGRVAILEGYPLNSIWGYQTDGLFQSADEVANWAFQNNLTGPGDVKYIDQNGDNRISIGSGTLADHGDLVYLGTDQPRLTFGINGSLAWKGLDFSFFLQGVGSRKFVPSRGAVNPQEAAWVQPLTVHMDYWTEENRNATFPRPYMGGGHNFLNADWWTLNGGYMRLKNVQLGYSLPEKLLSKVKVSRARIYMSGQDLLTFSRLGQFNKIFNPEYVHNAAFPYPFPATAAMGLNLTF